MLMEMDKKKVKRSITTLVVILSLWGYYSIQCSVIRMKNTEKNISNNEERNTIPGSIQTNKTNN